MGNEKHSSAPSLSEEQILELGMQASEMLKNPVFGIICQTILVDAQRAIDVAEPDHVKTVMWNKQMRQMVGEFCRRATGLRTQAETVLQERQRQNSPEFKEQQKLDEQGFGLNFGGSAQ